jgi:hypothetical protein
MGIKLCLIYLKLIFIIYNMNNNLVAEIKLIRKYIQKQEVKNLYKESKQKYEDHLSNKFKNFSENKPFLFDMIIDYNKFDFEKLNKFLGVINNIHLGKISTEDASKMVGQMQYDEYVKNKVTDEKENEIKIDEVKTDNEIKIDEVKTDNEIKVNQPVKKQIDTDLEYV